MNYELRKWQLDHVQGAGGVEFELAPDCLCNKPRVDLTQRGSWLQLFKVALLNEVSLNGSEWLLRAPDSQLKVP